MAIEDPNPERRNLVVTSLAFIAYYYGGGAFENHEVELHVISVTFKNFSFLAAMAWCGLFWFAYRYRLLNSREFRNHFRKEISLYHSHTSVLDYVSKKTSEPFFRPGEKQKIASNHISTLSWKGWYLMADYVFSASISRNPDGTLGSFTGGGVGGQAGTVVFEGRRGWITAIRVICECYYTHPSFSSYAVPYLLFFAALFGPVYKFGF